MGPSDLDPAVDYVFTIGHSNQGLDPFLSNLRCYSIEAVVDVRSQPVSKYTPHFNRNDLRWALHEAGVRYVFSGDVLGGRPSDPALYDDEGFVRYDLWSATAEFSEGITRLEHAARKRRLAILCSEEDPAGCHRHLLIARVLRARGWSPSSIVHIRSSGSYITDEEIPIQEDLFGGTVAWRSPQSVLHKALRSTSSVASGEQEFDDFKTSGCTTSLN